MFSYGYDVELQCREMQRQEWLKQSEILRQLEAEHPPRPSMVDTTLEKVGDWLITSGEYLKQRQQLRGESYGRADV